MIETLERQVAAIKDGSHDVIRPGLPYRINEAITAGYGVWQGDLAIEVVDAVPEGYIKLESPGDGDRQLVPGNTEGAKHALDSLDGVELYRPAAWPDVTDLGPAFVLHKERTVTHPTHGDVTIAAGHTVLCSYQREWDAEARQARRNAD